MHRANHLHIRCPGNIGLLTCVAQIFFPKKPKTVKYAGNWDPYAVQAFSYRLQKKILNSTFLSKNVKVLVYGKWTGMSKNLIQLPGKIFFREVELNFKKPSDSCVIIHKFT